MCMKPDWCCIAAVNDDRLLAQNLAASSDLRSDREKLLVLKGYPSASAAYNAGLEKTSARYCIFAHQDVYLPVGWLQRLFSEIDRLDKFDSRWAILGVFGVNRNGDHVGRVWSTGLGTELGTPFDHPIGVQSVDELLIVVDRSKNLSFDIGLPGYHLYGTDIVMRAQAEGYTAYVVHAPVIHNSRPVKFLGRDFLLSERYLRRKWKGYLPIRTAVTTITRTSFPTRSRSWRRWLRTRKIFRNTSSSDAPASTRADPVEIAVRLGYE